DERDARHRLKEIATVCHVTPSLKDVGQTVSLPLRSKRTACEIPDRFMAPGWFDCGIMGKLIVCQTVSLPDISEQKFQSELHLPERGDGAQKRGRAGGRAAPGRGTPRPPLPAGTDCSPFRG